MSTNPDFADLDFDVATQRTLEVATGIFMRWDGVDAPEARAAIRRIATCQYRSVDEVATTIICFAALGRRMTATEGA
jgi:AmiR/NasT family two-component response regulator